MHELLWRHSGARGCQRVADLQRRLIHEHRDFRHGAMGHGQELGRRRIHTGKHHYDGIDTACFQSTSTWR